MGTPFKFSMENRSFNRFEAQILVTSVPATETFT